MIPLTLPLVEARIAQIAELNLHHQEMATNARNNENVMNDLIAASEVHSQNSLSTFQHLKHSTSPPWSSTPMATCTRSPWHP